MNTAIQLSPPIDIVGVRCSFTLLVGWLTAMLHAIFDSRQQVIRPSRTTELHRARRFKVKQRNLYRLIADAAIRLTMRKSRLQQHTTLNVFYVVYPFLAHHNFSGQKKLQIRASRMRASSSPCFEWKHDILYRIKT